jgi:hypothetical protein
MTTYIPPKKSVEYIFYMGLVSQSTGQFQSNPTLAAGDFKVSIDGGALNNLGTLPAVTPAASKMVKVTLANTEMNGDNITVVASDAAGAEWDDVIISLQTSANQIDDLATPTNITAGTITTTTNLTNLPAITSNWLTAAGIAAGALNGKGDWNIGKTGYALSSAGIQAIWDALTSALSTVGSIGKLLVDNINATISSRSSHTAADIWAVATRLLTAGTNIVLAKGTGITGFNDLSTGDVRTAVGLASANLDTQLSGIQSDTNDIQSRLPAALSGDGFIKADLQSIDDELTNGNNATLNLKGLSIQRTDGGDAFVVSTNGFGYPLHITGDEVAAVTIDAFSAGGVNINVSGGDGLSITTDTGDGIYIDAGLSGINIDAVNKSINAPQDIAVSDGDLTLANIADSILKRDWNSVTGESDRSTLNALRKLRNKVSFAGGTLSIKKEDDITNAYTQAVTQDSDQEPFKSIG